jgi:hypothetical protein
MRNRTYHPRNQPVDGYRVQEHPLYQTWAGMLARCYNPETVGWENYGGRGIKVCNRWHHFANFAKDMGLKPSPELSLDRRDNAQGYKPSNCRWATGTEQCLNRRTFKNNTSGATGVTDVTTRITRYSARYDYEGRKYEIGRFNTVEEASAAREAFIGLFHTDRAAAEEMLEEPTVWCTSSTGVRGVTRHKDGGFIARTTVNRQRRYVGYFPTVEEAAAALSAVKNQGTK